MFATGIKKVHVQTVECVASVIGKHVFFCFRIFEEYLGSQLLVPFKWTPIYIIELTVNFFCQYSSLAFINYLNSFPIIYKGNDVEKFHFVYL